MTDLPFRKTPFFESIRQPRWSTSHYAGEVIGGWVITPRGTGPVVLYYDRACVHCQKAGKPISSGAISNMRSQNGCGCQRMKNSDAVL
jgi:hypothetical protein